ncbi:TPA: transposase, partial [Escherichia coli]|nr:transposase [Escherichia coli]
MVELSHRPEISVAQLAREHGINDNLLFKWRQYWREGKLRPPSTTENNVPRDEKRLLPAAPCCPNCGGSLSYLGEDTAEQLELMRSAFRVIRTVREKH